MMNSQTAIPAFWRRLDALLLAALVLARIRIDTLAEAAVLPLRQQDVARQPWLGHLLPPQAMELLAQQQLVDPIGLLLIVAALGCLLVYLLAHEFVRGERARYRVRLALIWAIVLLTVCAPSVKLILLRQSSGPASYSHDGGVIQTEATIDFLLQGKNPYVEDYTDTPMAGWGINEFRTALYHYPYLPWTFLFSAPFKLLAGQIIGWYDQRFVYLLLFALTLLLLPGLVRGRTGKLLLVMLIGLNPIMGSDLIYGQNDSFVLAWIVLSLWLWRRGQVVRTAGGVMTDENAGAEHPERRAAARSRRMRSGLAGKAASFDCAGRTTALLRSGCLRIFRADSDSGRNWTWASAAAFGLACASKPTAWFLAPFYLMLVAGAPTPPVPPSLRGKRGDTPPSLPLQGREGGRGDERGRTWLHRAISRAWPALAVMTLVVGPYLAWNPAAIFDDVWRWANGTSTTAYQIWGWGASNLALAFGWVGSRFAYWPFWLPQMLVGLPLLGGLLWRQTRDNTLGRALWGYGLFLLAFTFVSRFLNENYLGFVLALLALGTFVGEEKL